MSADKLRFETNIRGCSEDSAIAYGPNGQMAVTTTDDIDKAMWEAAASENFGMGESTPIIVWQNGGKFIVSKPGVNQDSIGKIEDNAARKIVDRKRSSR
ncbi:MAG TPA: hypothetical protein VF189_02990 [Patescibacteria group bacterium]